MLYFFVLGKNTALSLAELNAVLDLKNLQLLSSDFLLAESERELIPNSLIKTLGGVIKIGRIIAKIKDKDSLVLEKKIQEIALDKQINSNKGKFNFGFSNYSQQKFNNKYLGLRLKQFFKKHNISSRFVTSREDNLSSVAVTRNKLLSRGIEIVLSVYNGQILIGETLAVQAFKDLSLRDYGRPARDDHSGMLPPKLAQIMLNLAQIMNKDALIIDPFCGSGTILSEALLLGYKNLFASDVSFKAITDTRKNISWLRELYKINDVKLKFFVKKVESLSKFVKSGTVSAIVTEPYLGPQRGKLEFSSLIKDLEKLYSLALAEFRQVLVDGGRVVMVWPLYYGTKMINPDYMGFRLLDMVPTSLKPSKFIKKQARPSIVYGRPGQKVYREIVVLEKI